MKIKLLLFVQLLLGCGVRGRPEIPTTPPFLGSGKAQPVEKKVNIKKQTKIKGDWEEEDDFLDEKK